MKANVLSLIGFLSLAAKSGAVVLASYVPTDSAASNPNNAPISAATQDPLVAASVIGDIATGGGQLGSGASGPLRTTNGTWTFGTGAWLFANAQADGSTGTASSTADYFSFDLSTPGTETLTLETLSFDYGVGTNATGQSGTFHYAVFASVNGGAFSQLGSTFSSGSLTLVQNATHFIGSQSLDLSSITGADSVAFRVWVGSTNGSGSTGSIFRNIAVNGVTVPEPSSAMLAGLGLLALWHRRRIA